MVVPGLYPVTLTFTDDYPIKPPSCAFPEGFFHPNVYPSGKVCLSIVNSDGTWKPSISIKQARSYLILSFPLSGIGGGGGGGR
jgi:ubiquitin-protein ligase